MPHSAAGWRIEPPVSVPVAAGARRAATAAAEPPEEPPGTRRGSTGSSPGRRSEVSLDEPIANSSMLVLPSVTMPAAFERSITCGVVGATKFSSIFEPQVVSQPSAQKMSLCASGMPVSGRPRRATLRASAARACGERFLGIDGDEGVEPGIERVDAVEEEASPARRWKSSSAGPAKCGGASSRPAEGLHGQRIIR
jgi:hypothetical protein